jgi:hypothetical protein
VIVTTSPAKIIGALLTGRATLFGARVELLWPDGPPAGWSEADLLATGERWWAPAPTDRPEELERALLGPALVGQGSVAPR